MNEDFLGAYGENLLKETLIPAVEELDQAYQKYMTDPEFMAELDMDFQHYVGRPSPLYHAPPGALVGRRPSFSLSAKISIIPARIKLIIPLDRSY
ncbi:MAG: hypothetical protein H0A75_05640 [Candidatus Methanofishera endochildressiae]|uniref:Tryptophan synthase n=1 Tax=Candidatus Methanofishera endochildressiae TaxID=2738884 RepID=A0A7Z0SDN5_9GAMM|nr:hypothetical protein [Candidatus Methanofishera endochildressiae]